MQPLYTDYEFKIAKSRQLLPLRCIHCSKTFFRTKNDLKCLKTPNHQNRGHTGEYCSLKCAGLSRINNVLVQCRQCNKPVSVRYAVFEKNKNQNRFCSQSCAAKWNNAHKTKGTRVSKLEVWLSQELPRLYPNLEFHFNRKDAINGELDIYIPSLRLAFELNGVFHYEPIYGPDKLASIQSNDTRKFQACIEHGIELCIIDASNLSYFKEQQAGKYLKIIQNIIEQLAGGRWGT